MTEKLIDVLNADGNVLHTYRITLPAGDDDEFMAKALEAAASGRLVPDETLHVLSARVHHSRGGQLAPYDTLAAANSQTKEGLEDEVRERAYLLWVAEGKPEGRAEEFWHRARDQHLRERAYVLWQQSGSPDGEAGRNMQQVLDFQAD